MDEPRLTPSMRSALQDVELDRLIVIYPGALGYPIAENIIALPITQLANPGPIDLLSLP